MTRMKINKLSESCFHVHVADCFSDEDVNAAQFLGRAARHTVGVMPVDILDQFEGPTTQFIA